MIKVIGKRGGRTGSRNETVGAQLHLAGKWDSGPVIEPSSVVASCR